MFLLRIKGKYFIVIYHLALLSAAVIWASTFANIKIVLLQVPPNTLAFLRFLIASIALGVFFLLRRQPRIKRNDWPRVALGGLTGMTMYNFLQNQGLLYAGATDAAIMASMAPVFMVLMAWFFLKEKVSISQVGGIFLALTGSLLVSTNGLPGHADFNPSRLYGDFLVLLTGVSWGIYNTIIKPLLTRYPATSVLTYCTFAGTIFLLPFAMLEFPVNIRAINLWGWINIFYLGLVASALAYLLWNTSLTKVATATAAAYIYLIPVVTALLAAVFLHEVLTLYTIIGGWIVLAGTYFASKATTPGNLSERQLSKQVKGT